MLHLTRVAVALFFVKDLSTIELFHDFCEDLQKNLHYAKFSIKSKHWDSFDEPTLGSIVYCEHRI